MARTKLKKFKEIELMSNIIEPSKDIYKKVKGHWNEKVFNDSNPIVLELACGYGNYTNGLAEVFRDQNYIGVDIKGERVWKGGKDADEKNLDNAKFLRCPIELINKFFDKEEVSQVWITFADPQANSPNKRLTADKFLDLYKEILVKDGLMHLKTDSALLFESTLKVLSKRKDIKDLQITRDFYNSEFEQESYGIKTGYESKYLALGVKIKYLQFKFI